MFTSKYCQTDNWLQKPECSYYITHTQETGWFVLESYSYRATSSDITSTLSYIICVKDCICTFKEWIQLLHYTSPSDRIKLLDELRIKFLSPNFNIIQKKYNYIP